MAAPYAPPPPVPPRHRRRGGGVVVPLILIFVGAVFLLQNTGYLPPNFWLNLWRLWPLVLVLVGLELLLAHRVPWLALLALAALVLIVGSAATNSNMPVFGSGSSTQTTSTSATTTLNGANQAAVTIRYGAGQLNIGPINTPAADELATMTYSGPTQVTPQAHYSVTSGGVGQLDYASGGRPGAGTGAMNVNLSPDVPIASLNLTTGATEAHVDLSQLRVTTLDISIGAATAWVRFPTAAGLTTAHISGGASTITIEVPDGVAAQIQEQGGLSTLKVDQTRFPQVSDNVYRSANYDTASNKVDLTIETGVTTIQIN